MDPINGCFILKWESHDSSRNPRDITLKSDCGHLRLANLRDSGKYQCLGTI